MYAVIFTSPSRQALNFFLGIDAIIPQDSVDLPFTIPCLTDPRCSSLEVTRKPPENMAGYGSGHFSFKSILTEASRMISWLKSFPLPIVQHVVHFLCPQSKGWRFILGNDCDGDESIFQYFTWSTMDLDSPMNARNSAIIAFQPPWILSEQDMREFSECRSVSTTAFGLRIACIICPLSFPLFGNWATLFLYLFKAKKGFGPK